MPFTRAHDDEELLEEVRRVVALVPSGPVTQEHFKQMSSLTSVATLLRLFGGWREVLTSAGLGDRYSGRTVSPKMRLQRSRTLTDAEIIAELQRVAAVAGSTTLVLNDVRMHSEILGSKVLLKRFGSFPAALAAAGLNHSPMANRWTEDDYLDNMRQVWAHYGRAPSATEIGLPPSRISADSYKRRYGSWEQAKRAVRL